MAEVSCTVIVLSESNILLYLEMIEDRPTRLVTMEDK